MSIKKASQGFSLTFVWFPYLVEALRERPRVQEQEDRRRDRHQRDQLAQPEKEHKEIK